mmetsp:Transcript_34895/g.75348  ORF Transcript_34895/g.75348 Transcript_34895/m.75348 type:complete len:159 (+) Transcript_34895:318-794(+)
MRKEEKSLSSATSQRHLPKSRPSPNTPSATKFKASYLNHLNGGVGPHISEQRETNRYSSSDTCNNTARGSAIGADNFPSRGGREGILHPLQSFGGGEHRHGRGGSREGAVVNNVPHVSNPSSTWGYSSTGGTYHHHHHHPNHHHPNLSTRTVLPTEWQ